MSNVSYYLEALIDLCAPASAAEVHAKALQMFGPHRVKGDRQSCRQSLDRHVLRGLATRSMGGKYQATDKANDPVRDLYTQLRVAQTQLETTQSQLAAVQAQLATAQARIAELEGAK